MIINATEKNIIIESNEILGNIVINNTLAECNVEIIEIIINTSHGFSETEENVIFTVKQGINYIDIFELEKSIISKKIFLVNGVCEPNICIPIKSKTKSKKYSYMLTIQLLNGKTPSLEYIDPNILELTNIHQVTEVMNTEFMQ